MARSGRAEPLSPPPETWRMLIGAGGWSLLTLGLLFLGLQVWWIGSLLRRRALVRPLSEREFRRVLERIWARDD